MSLLKVAGTTSAANSKLYVDDVFSTYLYTGNGASQTITNGIDLAGKGGMVWLKGRSVISSNTIYDTSRGVSSRLITNVTNGTFAGNLTSFNSNGFTLSAANAGELINATNDSLVSWTFRKAAKFFDVVTWTGNGLFGREINHSLGVKPGMIIIKRTDLSSNWLITHRVGDDISAGSIFYFDGTPSISDPNGQKGYCSLGSTTDNAKFFLEASINGPVGYQVYDVNDNNATYVAYLFAHDASSTGIIQCGSYSVDAVQTQVTVNLGYEPQWLLIKRATGGTGAWYLFDNMRGITTGGDDAQLQAQSTGSEAALGGVDAISLTSTGFQTGTNATVLQPSSDYIYMAIRRPNKPPTSGTQVYNAIARTGTGAAATVTGVGFSPDSVWIKTNNNGVAGRHRNRVTGPTKFLHTESSDTEQSDSDKFTSFDMNGFSFGATSANDFGTQNYLGFSYINYCFKRAPGFFDVVCYTGNDSDQSLSHNLGVKPQLIFTKARTAAPYSDWYVYSETTSAYTHLILNSTAAVSGFDGGTWWSYVEPTTSIFHVNYTTGRTGHNYVAYLFATLAGISKVGSYTGNGGTQNIECGFASKYSAFVLIKRTDSTGDWYIWDTARGITTDTAPHLSLNTTAAEVSSDNSVDLSSGGFVVIQNSTTNINVTSATYIYLSIAGDTYSTGGEAVFTTPGTTTWTAPAGVTSVSVVCVGGGGGGATSTDSYGSGGGGLGYNNYYPVTPGNSYTVVVGAGGSAGNLAGDSYFVSTSVVKGGAGPKSSLTGGTFVGDGGGNGGGGGTKSGTLFGGGGGAGGYSGNGGAGGNGASWSGTAPAYSAGSNGSGGGGGGGYGGGGNGGTAQRGSWGGGVDIFGQGANGIGSTIYGNDAGTGSFVSNRNIGRGALQDNGISGSYSGGNGAVRIIWGSGRAFPSAAA